MRYADRLSRLETQAAELRLDALAGQLAARLGQPPSATRAALAVKVEELQARYRALGDWDAVVAACAADLGVPVAELQARAAQWEV